MNKPNNYDNTQVGGYQPIEVGGHTCIIKQVKETCSKNGQPMVVVLFDFAQDDKQAGYFTESFNNDTRADKKWPFGGSCWIMVNDYGDNSKTSRKFKAFCTCYEQSNNTKVSWGDADWGKQFKGKKIGVVFGMEEEEYNGEYRIRPRMKWFCNYSEAKDAKVPEVKYMKNKPASTAPVPNVPAAPAGYVEADDELPF